jgi:hypothetical protein
LIQSERQNYVLAQKLIKLISQKYQLGNATTIEIIIAQQSLENAEYHLNNLSYNAKIAKITYKQLASQLRK